MKRNVCMCRIVVSSLMLVWRSVVGAGNGTIALEQNIIEAALAASPFPLSDAISNSNWPLFHALARTKYKDYLHVNELNDNGFAAVHVAAVHRSPVYLQHLISRTEALGIDWNVQDSLLERTALHRFMGMPENLDLLKAMLAIPTLNVNALDESSYTPLHYAIHACSEINVRALLEHPDIDPNIEGDDMYTPIMEALAQHQPVGITALMQHPNIDLTVRDQLGSDILMIALLNGLSSPYIAQIINHPGYTLDIYNSDDEDQTILDYAVKAREPAVLRVVLARSFAINELIWRRVMLVATMHNDLENLQILLAPLPSPAEMITRSHEDDPSVFLTSILHLARDVTVYLLQHFPQVDVNEATTGTTPLMSAIITRQSDIALSLLERPEISVNVQEVGSHKTSLFFAVQEKQYKVLGRLLRRDDIDIELPNNAGITPFRLAIDRNDELAQEVFKKYFVLKYHHSIAQLAFPEPMLLQMGQDMVRRSISSFETLSEAKQKEYSGWITKREHEVMLTRLGIPIRQRERLPPLRRSERLAAKRLKIESRA